MRSNPETQKQKGRVRSFSLEEDLLILEKILPRLESQKLSITGFLPQSEILELATEFLRNPFSTLRATTGGIWPVPLGDHPSQIKT